MGLVEVTASSPSEFLQFLHFNNPFWRYKSRKQWAFRGQGRSNWPLVPSAFRPNVVLSSGQVGPSQNYIEQCWQEYRIIRRFVFASDEVGLPVPGDGPLFRTPEGVDRTVGNCINGRHWPLGELHQAVALAQHHGVPTRFLDFTYNRYVATYFAATKALDLNKKGESVDSFSIWAINMDFVWEQWPGLNRPTQDILLVVTVPYALNHFLRVQEGFFLCVDDLGNSWEALYRCYEESGKTDPWPVFLNRRYGMSGEYPCLAEYLLLKQSSVGALEDVLVKISIPSQFAEELLNTLDEQENINRISMMPTYDNAAAYAIDFSH